MTFELSTAPLPPSKLTPTKLAETLSWPALLFVEVAVADKLVPRSTAPVSLPALVVPPRLVVTNCAAPTRAPTLTPVVDAIGVEVDVAAIVAAPLRNTLAPLFRLASVVCEIVATVRETDTTPPPTLTVVVLGVAIFVEVAVRPSVLACSSPAT